MATASKKAAVSRWHELAAEFPLRPIRSGAELDRAIVMIDRLLDQPELSEAEEDYQVVLAGLVHAYEQEHEPVEAVTTGELLAHLIEAKGVSQVGAAAVLGCSKATITQIIKGERKPGRRLMAKMGDYFAVNPAAFL